MTNQSEQPEATKTDSETVSEDAAQKRLDHVAEESAEKSSRTEQRYDEDHQIFSK